MVSFGFLAGPIFKPAQLPGGIKVREAEKSSADLRVTAGKSVIMDSAARIVDATVENPNLLRAVAIDEHELLLNGKIPGRTNVTLIQEDGRKRHFDVYVDGAKASANVPLAGVRTESAGDDRRLTDAYQDAMMRVQSAITGVDR
jgi:Flp pilus assembly secretin CpaC